MVGLAAPALLLATLTTTVPAAAAWEPPPRTIVAVGGNPDDGFVVRRFNGTVEFTTTRSEALAECSEMDRLMQRVRCRTFVRVRYADLTAIKRAIRWARQSA